MPTAKKSAKKAAKKPAKSFEETLWDTANKLRGSVESSDWSGATKTTRQGCPEGERGGANQNGVTGFVLANGSMSTNTKGDCHARSATIMPKANLQSLTRQGEIRQKLVENDLVEKFRTAPVQSFH